VALPSVTVTPTSPLNISSAVPGYDTVTLQGGVIIITARNTFTINKLIQDSSSESEGTSE
jgi:hypothetical protein